MANHIKSVLRNFSTSADFNKEHLDLIKREIYGEFMRSLDSIENLSSQLASFQSQDESYLELPSILSSLQLAELEQVGQSFIEKMEASEFTIFPN